MNGVGIFVHRRRCLPHFTGLVPDVRAQKRTFDTACDSAMRLLRRRTN